MNKSLPFTFLTTFSKSGMPLILTDTATSSVLSINAAAIKYLNEQRIYITSSKELINILQSITSGKTPPAQCALEFQSQLFNNVRQPIELTIRVQQEFLSGKPVLLFSIVGSKQITGTSLKKQALPPETTSPLFLIGLTAEGAIEFVNRAVMGVDINQVLGSKIESWTLSDKFGDIHYFEQAIATALPVIYETRILGPNGLLLEAKVYLSPVFEQEELIGFIIATIYSNENQQD